MASLRFQASAVACLLVLGVSACATPSDTDVMQALAPAPPSAVETAALLAVADRALDNGEYRDAYAQYGRVLEADPKNENARIGIAETYLAASQAKEALAIFREVGNSTSPKVRLAAHQGQGICLLMLGEAQPAYDALARVVAEDPSLWRSWLALGRYHDQQQAWSASAEAYQRSLATTTRPHMVHNNWGMSLLAQGRPAEAALHFEQALTARPDFDVARNNLRLALALQGKYEEALAGADGTELPSALNNVGYAALLRGDTEEAQKYLTRAMETSPRFNEVAWRNLRRIEGE